MSPLEWTSMANRKVNDWAFPKNRIRYVSRFRELAGTLSREGDLALHLGSGPKDVGACPGLERRGVRVINLDLSLQDLQKNPGASKVCADAEELPLPANRVDDIYSEHVFEHFAAPGQVLAECFRVLKPGGRLVVSGPNGWSYIALAARLTTLGFHNRVRRLNSGGGRELGNGFQTFYRFSTPRTMRRMAQESGFEVTAFERFVGEPCYTTFLPALHLLFVAYHMILERLRPLFGVHITAVAVFRKPSCRAVAVSIPLALVEQGQ